MARLAGEEPPLVVESRERRVGTDEVPGARVHVLAERGRGSGVARQVKQVAVVLNQEEPVYGLSLVGARLTLPEPRPGFCPRSGTAQPITWPVRGLVRRIEVGKPRVVGVSENDDGRVLAAVREPVEAPGGPPGHRLICPGDHHGFAADKCSRGCAP